MLGVLWKILFVIGWILLAVLLLLLTVLLLVLFYPVTYVGQGKRDEESMEAWVKFRWLLGLVRAEYRYPDPGSLVVKVLGIKLFDSKSDGSKAQGAGAPGSDASGTKASEAGNAGSEASERGANPAKTVQAGENPDQPQDGTGQAGENPDQAEERTAQAEKSAGQPGGTQDQSQEGAGQTQADAPESQGSTEAIRSKAEQLRQTAEGLTGTFRQILSNLQYYLELLREEDTTGLLAHGFFRLGRMLRSLRPRQVSGNLYFSAGSPDTTGYCMALYGMLFPILGNHLVVTPDFESDSFVLTGELYLKGRMRASVFLYHIVRVLLDRRLYSRIKKIKKGGQKNGG